MHAAIKMIFNAFSSIPFVVQILKDLLFTIQLSDKCDHKWICLNDVHNYERKWQIETL